MVCPQKEASRAEGQSNTAMSRSVRSRIEDFEALSRGSGGEARDSSKDRRNEVVTEKRRRFFYPGNTHRSSESPTANIRMGLTAKSRPSGLTNFESDLQEVWSVRKNIHHTGQMLPRAVPSSVQVTAAGGQYSRHGAIPAQQSMKGHQALGTKDNSIKGLTARKDEFEVKRLPLQEHNSLESKWNIRTNFSYSEASKGGSPHHQPNGVLSPPTKRADVIRAIGDRISPTKNVPKRESNDKVQYAKKMAQGYLQSVGIGQYTPQLSGYVRDNTGVEEGKPRRWKKLDQDQDEFDFDV